MAARNYRHALAIVHARATTIGGLGAAWQSRPRLSAAPVYARPMPLRTAQPHRRSSPPAPCRMRFPLRADSPESGSGVRGCAKAAGLRGASSTAFVAGDERVIELPQIGISDAERAPCDRIVGWSRVHLDAWSTSTFQLPASLSCCTVASSVGSEPPWLAPPLALPATGCALPTDLAGRGRLAEGAAADTLGCRIGSRSGGGPIIHATATTDASAVAADATYLRFGLARSGRKAAALVDGISECGSGSTLRIVRAMRRVWLGALAFPRARLASGAAGRSRGRADRQRSPTIRQSRIGPKPGPRELGRHDLPGTRWPPGQELVRDRDAKIARWPAVRGDSPSMTLGTANVAASMGVSWGRLRP